MANTDNKLNTLPPNIKAYLTSLKAANLNSFIFGKNGVSSENYVKATKIITDLFTKELKVSDLPAAIKKELGLNDLNSKNLACDIVGIRLLVIKDWLGENLEEYIKNWGGNPVEYSHFIEDQKKALIEEEKYFASELQPESEFIFKPKVSYESAPNPVLDINKEKTDSIDLFKNNLVNLLNSGAEKEFISEYNLVLISLISGDPVFKQNLENALYSNAEELTTGRLKDEEKDMAPTIGNWVKDFIKQNGSEIFDELALIDYLSKSPNAKALSAAEKELVKKAIKLYRNIAFFPESMDNAPIEDWEIMPLDTKGEDVLDEGGDSALVDKFLTESRPKAPAKAVKTGKEDILESKPESAPVKETTSSVKSTLEEPKPVSQLEELEETIKRYSSSSLEYKVIDQEIRRLKEAEAKKKSASSRTSATKNK